MAATNSNSNQLECETIVNDEQVLAAFDALLPNPPADASDEEIAERQLARFRQIGIPLELTDNPDDGYEFLGPDGAWWGCGTPPLSAQDRVQRVLGAIGQISRKAERDGSKRREGRRKGKASVVAERNSTALTLITRQFPDWRKEPLDRARLNDIVYCLKLSSIFKSHDALRMMLERSKR